MQQPDVVTSPPRGDYYYRHSPPTGKAGHDHGRRTNILIWLVAVICTILTIVVIITGVVVFVGYMIIRPKVPQISIPHAHLDRIYHDMERSMLTIQATVDVRAENGNLKADASFYDTSFVLSFGGVRLAYLVAPPFDVKKNSTVELNYVVQSSPVPLGPQEADAVEQSLRQQMITFDLTGTTRTRWRVWLIGSVKFWLHLNCQLRFPIDGSTINPSCTSKSK